MGCTMRENNLTELNYNAYVNLNNIYKIHVKHFIGFKVKTWTVTTTETLNKALSYGVDLIMTDALTDLYEE